MRARWLLALSVVAAVLLGAAPAQAQTYPLPTTGQATVDRSSVRAGECVTFSGSGFAPGAVIDLADNGEPRGTTTANAAGDYSTRICFSTDAQLGAHVLSAQGQGANGALRTLTATVTVLGVATGGGTQGVDDGQGGGVLARTGGEIAAVVLAALVLLAAGALLVTRARGRRTA